MSDQARLSELCSICNTSASKYRCPACRARTCSLPCYKRHQQWAQCSGVRDATKFIKKSQLATPAGVDHDFNFLTGIERAVDRAERTLGATANPAPSESPSKIRRQTREIRYSHLENLTGVKIVRAPPGLSRQVANKSYASSTKKAKPNVVWTVEWINHVDRHMLTETSSTCTLAAADPFDCNQSRKRKLCPDTLDPEPSTSATIFQDASISTTNHKSIKLLEPLEQELSVNKQQQHPERPGSGSRASHSTKEEVIEATKGEEDAANASPSNLLHDGSITKPLGHEQHGFFLLRPRTTSTRRVLIPLNQAATLAECLRGQTVLEFPTIYTFPRTKTQLSEEFMLEEDYHKQEGEEQEEFDKMMRDLDPEILRRLKEDRPQDDGEQEEESVSERILDVLKQDLGADF